MLVRCDGFLMFRIQLFTLDILVFATALDGRNFFHLYIARICNRFRRLQLWFFYIFLLFATALDGRNFCFLYFSRICNSFATESVLVFSFVTVLLLVAKTSVLFRLSCVGRKFWSQLLSFLVVFHSFDSL
ncbi:hypothetical protein HanPSC8_Chr11g0456711 [Helianthus annuus]|nr:hypothetical protein HanPSC8_Chr11g0456711 [Helianthus annuus]